MKKISIFSVIIFIIIFGFIPFRFSLAQNISVKMKGKILLQVESKGEAWYVNPKDSKRYYMADGNSAYDVMRNLGVGVTNSDLAKIQKNKVLAKKQGGKILLKVEDKGQAYYVNSDGTIYYLKDGNAAYGVMRSLGLGITNKDLNKIALANSSSKQSNNSETSSSAVTNQNDYSRITTDDVAPYLTGVVEIVCKKKDINGIEQLNSTGSGSLIGGSSSNYMVLTNNHVISGEDQCFVVAPNLNGGVAGIYELNLTDIKNWNNIADEAAIPIIASAVNRLNSWDSFSFNVDINKLNYNLWNLKNCSSDMSKASPVMVIGYPAFSVNDVASALKDQIVADGIISGYNSSSISDGLPYSNYYVSAKVDSGDSGGIALSKDKNGLCILGIPTWITNTGNYSNEGLVQNMNNIVWANHIAVKTLSNEEVCKNKFGVNSVWSGTTNNNGGAICDCASGYEFNSSQTECISSEYYYNQLCQNKYGSNSQWSGELDSSSKPTCNCQSGYYWDFNGTSCSLKAALQAACSYVYGYFSYYYQSNGEAHCECLSGYYYSSSLGYCTSYY